MPTYDYECTSCPHTFEHFQPISARPLSKCPRCGAKVRRLIGAGAGVIFKGSGFYETDYKRKKPTSPNGGKPDGGKAEKTPSEKSGD